jgi:hypothetical protein
MLESNPILTFDAVLGILSNLGCSSSLQTIGYDSQTLFMGFIGTSILLSLILTTLITYEIRSSMCQVTSTGNTHNRGWSNPYSSITIIIVESAAAWTATALAYLIALVVDYEVAVDSTIYRPIAALYFVEYIFQIMVVG